MLFWKGHIQEATIDIAGRRKTYNEAVTRFTKEPA